MSEFKKPVLINAVLLGCIAVFGFVLVDALVPRDRKQDVSRLQSALPTIAKYHVRVYQKFSDCHSLAYARGQFTKKQTRSAVCTHYEVDQPFDAQAESDFATIDAALSATGPDVDSIEASIDTGGGVRYAEFHINCMQCGGDRYAYALGGGDKRLPEPVPNNLWVTRIYGAWYLIQESWH